MLVSVGSGDMPGHCQPGRAATSRPGETGRVTFVAPSLLLCFVLILVILAILSRDPALTLTRHRCAWIATNRCSTKF